MSTQPAYDASLLASAPQVTREMKQEGYNPYLLAEESKPKPAKKTPVVPVGKELPANPPRKQPFFRTRNGIITIVVLVLVILAAVIGGAVGGTRHKSHTNTTNPFSSSSSNGQAVGVATTGSPTATITTTLTSIIASTAQPGGQVESQTTTITSTITEFAAATSTGGGANGVGTSNPFKSQSRRFEN